MNIQGVPALLIDGETVIGFDRRRIEELLAQSIIGCSRCGSKLRIPSGKGTIMVTCPRCGERFRAST